MIPKYVQAWRGRIVLSGALFLLLIVLLFTMSAFGSADISWKSSAAIILEKIVPFFDSGEPDTFKLIVLKIRLPRIVLSALAGMALAASGVVFQGIFRNPMADPYILGISSGAGLGVTLMLVLNIPTLLLGSFTVPAAAFLGALGTTFLVFMLSGSKKDGSVVPLLLSGIAVNFFLLSCISLLMYLNRDRTEQIVFWTMGSFASAGWSRIGAVAPFILPSLILLFFFSRDLDLLAMGEKDAAGLGLNVPTVRKILLVLATLMTASAVAVSGVIGFVGLIIPHIIRLIFGPRHGVLLPVSILTGGIFLILADTIARTVIAPTEIPVGIVTAMLGAPYFLYLLRRRGHQWY